MKIYSVDDGENRHSRIWTVDTQADVEFLVDNFSA